MEQNRIVHKSLTLRLKDAILLCIVIIVLTTSSEVQASGRVFIRKAPGVDVKIQVPSTPGFNSNWVNPENVKSQNPVPMKFKAYPIRPGSNQVVPENPKQERSDNDSEPSYTGVELKKGIFLINVKGNPDKNQIMLPEPAGFCSALPSLKTDEPQPQFEIKPEEVFLNGEARRILVWNGKEDESSEQLLICNDRLCSVNGQIEAVLNIMPLPGKPLQIKRVSDSFDILEEELIKKTGHQRKGINNKLYIWNGRIASYCAQSIEAHNLDEFLRNAENMVSCLYGDSARLQWQPAHLSAVKLLLDKGYTWFSLDISMLIDIPAITEPIAYRSKTASSAVIPLHDGKIGGANEHTVTKAIVISPGKLAPKNKEIWTDDNVMILGNKSFEFTINELQNACPEAATFCREHKMDKVLVRLFILNNKITEYPDDLVIVNHKQANSSQPAAETPATPCAQNAPATNPAEKNGAHQAGNATQPAKNNNANPAEKPQDRRPVPSNIKQNPGKNKGVNPPA